MSLWLSIWPLARSQFDLSARNLVMVPLYVSHCYLYLLHVMVVEHYLVLSMPLIVAMGAWSRIGIMKFGMLLVTLLLCLGT